MSNHKHLFLKNLNKQYKFCSRQFETQTVSVHKFKLYMYIKMNVSYMY